MRVTKFTFFMFECLLLQDVTCAHAREKGKVRVFVICVCIACCYWGKSDNRSNHLQITSSTPTFWTNYKLKQFVCVGVYNCVCILTAK